MTEQAEVEPKPAKKRLLRICLIAIAVVVALVLVALLYMHIRMRMTEEEPEVYSGSVAELLKEIAAAQEKHFEKHEKYGTLKQLVDEKIIKHKKLATGKFAEYVYEMKLGDDGQDWGLTCWPEKPGEDTKSYFVDSRGEILFTDYTSASDEKANADSPPLWEEGGWESDE